MNSKHLNRIIILSLLLIITFSLGSYAFVVSGPNYKVNAIISGGGGDATHLPASGQPIKYKLHFAAMQQVIRASIGDTGKYKLCLGIFCTGLFEVPHYVSVSGTAYYDTGSVVPNSDAKLVVSVGRSNYESKVFKTDANGAFSTKVAIPESVANKDEFEIKIYISGRVDAVYRCAFHKTGPDTGTCS